MDTFTPKAEMERSARYFFALVMLLSVLGLVMIYSTTAVKSARGGREETELLLVQLMKMAVALTAMLVMMKMDYRVLARHHLKILHQANANAVVGHDQIADAKYQNGHSFIAPPDQQLLLADLRSSPLPSSQARTKVNRAPQRPARMVVRAG